MNYNLYLISESSKYSQDIGFIACDFLLTSYKKDDSGFAKYIKSLKGKVSKEVMNDLKHLRVDTSKAILKDMLKIS